MRRVALRPLGAPEKAERAGSAAAGHGGGPNEPNVLGSPLGLGSASGYEAVVEEEPVRGFRLGQAAGRMVRRGARPRAPKQPPLLHDERFRVFWLARLATQTAQGALLYAFLLIVADRTGSATYNSLFVICSILPSIVFGLPAGIVVDALPRRPLLIAFNAARFVFAIILVLSDPSLLGIFAATLALWTIHQFHAPLESAALTALVPRERLTSAQALSNLALTVAQLVGLVTLAPLLLRTAGPRTLFAVCAALFFVAAGLAAMLPRLDEHLRAPTRSRRSLRSTLLNGWRGVREHEVTYGALVTDVMVGVGVSALVVIMPLYLKGVLNTGAENTVFVFAPAALGLVVGLRFAPWVGRTVGERRVATAGLVGFATCVGSLGFVEELRRFLVSEVRLPVNQVADLAGIPALVLVAMMLSVPAGFCSSMVSVTARSLLLANTPPSRRGQTVATAALLGNVGALVPTLLAGIATDLFGVEPIAVAIAVVLLLGAIGARTLARPGPLRAPAPST